MPVFDPDELQKWSGGKWTAKPAEPPRGFSIDTRTLRKGDVFVALRTGKRDGHDFLEDAQEKGAVAAIVSRPDSTLRMAQLKVRDPLKSFQKIASARRKTFSVPVIGVTGSCGKTTTKDLLRILLGAPGTVHATRENLNNHLGVPLTLLEFDPARHKAAVIEAGVNSPGEMKQLAGMIRPDHVVVTMVGPAHLEGFETVANVAKEKAALVEVVRPSGYAVFPEECLAYPEFCGSPAGKLVAVDRENTKQASVDGETVSFQIQHEKTFTVLKLAIGVETERAFVLPPISGGLARNAALAIALASRLGIADQDIQPRLRSWSVAPYRGEFLETEGLQVYLDCYNASPASMADALESFHVRADPSFPRLYVLGCMDELGEEAARYHRELGGRFALRPEDRVLITGGFAGDFAEGFAEAGNDPSKLRSFSEPEEVRREIESFSGAVFVKGSRRYRLEQLLPSTFLAGKGAARC